MQLLHSFLEVVVSNPRFSPAHISLYTAILQHYCQQQKQPIIVYGRGLMKYAKIGGLATYHKALRDLQEFGFIEYEPSFNPLLGSKIILKMKCYESEILYSKGK